MGLLACAALWCGCRTDLDRSTSLITSPRILAVRADPPESAPGAMVAHTVFAADAQGPFLPTDLSWSFCSRPPTAADDSPASPSCITTDAGAAAVGPAVSLPTPADACRTFGPQISSQDGSKLRPPGPDITGGYHIPIRIAWADQITVAFQRLTCDPIGASLSLSKQYREARRPNQNPTLIDLNLDGSALPATVAAGARLHVTATWTPESRETYLVLDTEAQALLTRAENLWVAWYVTAGSVANDTSAARDTEAAAENTWQLPSSPGTFHLWAVLHDDRGGVDVRLTSVLAL